jgi:hypothetical protein
MQVEAVAVRVRALSRAPALGGLVILALLGSACGAASSAPPATRQSGTVAFAGCMRAHGVPRYPDPTSGGGLVKASLQQLGVSSSRFEAAKRTCQHLLPNGGRGPSPAQLQQGRALALEFARCVRAHGVPRFPDPGSDGRIPDPASVGIDQGSPKFEAANESCRTYRPPYIPSNQAYNSYTTTRAS